jgi:hypothetical protein
VLRVRCHSLEYNEVKCAVVIDSSPGPTECRVKPGRMLGRRFTSRLRSENPLGAGVVSRQQSDQTCVLTIYPSKLPRTNEARRTSMSLWLSTEGACFYVTHTLSVCFD